MAAKVRTASDLAEVSRVLASDVRVLIITFLKSKHAASWTEIRNQLEQQLGLVNPNTLHFHLKVLMAAKFVQRTGPDDTPLYELLPLPPQAEAALEASLSPSRHRHRQE